jgi:hypothetical protein
VDVPRDDVDVGVDHRDEGLAQVGVGQAGSFEQGTMGSAFDASFDRIRAHFYLIKKELLLG